MGRGTMFLVALTIGAVLAVVRAGDPELITDFFIPPGVNATSINSTFFTFTKLEAVTPTSTSFATVTPANIGAGFTALTGLGVSNALLLYPPGAINRPHTHPRGSETLFVIEGILNVGLLTSENVLFTATIGRGDIFVFPRGLVHFQVNPDPKVTTIAYASFSSSNAGTITLPVNLFKTPIDVNILAKSFNVTTDVILALQAGQT